MEIMLGEKWDVGSLSLSNDTSKNSHDFSGTSVVVSSLTLGSVIHPALHGRRVAEGASRWVVGFSIA